MLGLGGDNEDDQRLWNFLIFKVPVTDKELEEIDESVSFWWIIINYGNRIRAIKLKRIFT